MSTTTSACCDPRITAWPCRIIISSVTGTEAVHDVAEGVANQDDIAVAIHQRRGMRVVRGQHHDRLAVLARANIRRSFALDGRLN